MRLPAGVAITHVLDGPQMDMVYGLVVCNHTSPTEQELGRWANEPSEILPVLDVWAADGNTQPKISRQEKSNRFKLGFGGGAGNFVAEGYRQVASYFVHKSIGKLVKAPGGFSRIGQGIDGCRINPVCNYTSPKRVSGEEGHQFIHWGLFQLLKFDFIRLWADHSMRCAVCSHNEHLAVSLGKT